MNSLTNNPTVGKARTIYLAHSDLSRRKIIETILQTLDHDVPVSTGSGQELISACEQQRPDLIIAAPTLEDMDGIEAMIIVGQQKPVPGIVIASGDDLDEVERALDDHVMAYLVEPLTTQTLMPAIYLAERRFEHFQRLVDRIDVLETRLEERKVIERAKGIVMEVRGISEPQAHRLLQSAAAKNREKLASLAAKVCQTGDLLSPASDKEFP